MALVGSLKQLDIFVNTGIILNFFILFGVFLVIHYVYRRIKKIRIINKIPGPKPHLIFGNALQIRGDDSDKFKQLTETFCNYGSSICRVWIGSHPRCFLYKGEVVEELIKSKAKYKKGLIHQLAFLWLGSGIVTASVGTKWHQTRKMLTPAFHYQILEDFLEYFNEQSAKFVENIDHNANGEPFDIFEPITLCTLDSLLETVMGRSLNVQDNPHLAYVNATSRIQEILIHRVEKPWLFPDFMFKLLGYKKIQDDTLKVLNEYTDETIHMKNEALNLKNNVSGNKTEGVKKRFSFLDLLLENDDKKTIPGLNIHEEVNTLMFAGHDTISTAVFWTIYSLGAHREVQDKLLEEIDSVFGDKEIPITTDHLREMKYLDYCFKESMRLFPPIPIISRIILEDMTLGGYQIPAGTTVNVMIYRLHRDPEQFSDPEVFKPERFLPENCVNRHPYAYIPFSAGSRNCIGSKFAILEAKIMLCWFFRKYKVESTVKMKDLRLKRGFTLSSMDKDIVKLFRRK